MKGIRVAPQMLIASFEWLYSGPQMLIAFETTPGPAQNSSTSPPVKTLVNLLAKTASFALVELFSPTCPSAGVLRGGEGSRADIYSVTRIYYVLCSRELGGNCVNRYINYV